MPRALLACTAFTLVLAGCTHAPPAEGGPAPSERTSAPVAPVAESRARGVVIATVATHDAKVSILGRSNAREADLRLVVRKHDGTLLADGISVDELRTADPTLHSIVTRAIASGSGDTYLDATLDRRP